MHTYLFNSDKENKIEYVPEFPDDIFSFQKYQFGYFEQGPGMENVGTFLPFGILTAVC
jgi:hypothetical protein